MHESPFSFGTVLLYTPGKSRTTCHLFVSRQSPAEESSLGKLFVLTEIASPDKINEEIINAIQEELKSSYYNTDDLNIETAFEKALERVNQRIADMVGDYDTNWLDKLNAVAAVVTGSVIHLSCIGSIHAFLTRQGKISDILESAGGGEVASAKINPLKAFSSIISGDVLPDDTILICTSSLLDYFSQEKLKKTLTEHSPHAAAANMESLLGENANETAFGALILKREEHAGRALTSPALAQPPAPTAPVGLSPQSSMQALFNKQSATADILTPSLTRYLREGSKRMVESIGDTIRLKVFRQSPRRVRLAKEAREYQVTYQQRAATQTKTSPALRNRLSSGYGKARNATQAIGRTIRSLFIRGESVTRSIASPQAVSGRLNRTVVYFKSLPRVSKILIVLAIVTVVLLAQGIYSQAASQNRSSENVSFDETMAKLSQDVTKAEAALSYDNQDGARTLLTDARTSLDQLKPRGKDQETRVTELHSNINTLLEQTKHIVLIESPATVATITSTSGQGVNAASLVMVGTSLYTMDAAAKTIYGVSIGEKKVSSWPQDASEPVWQYLIPYDTRSFLIFSSSKAVREFNISSQKLTGLTFPLADDVNVAALASYETRVYIADIKGNTIFRTTRAGNAFSTPAEWLKDDTSIDGAKSMVVDGNIYLLKGNGEVIKFFQGVHQAWSLASVDPALTRADAIWSSTSSEQLYIVDRQGKRIIEFSKEGALLNQYTSPAFGDIRGITVDTADKKLYLLNGATVFTVDLAE